MKIIDYINCDILVVGGGPSGIIAAKAAREMGANVILVEKSGYLGGCNTKALVMPLMTFHSGEKQIIKGFAEELIQEVIKNEGAIGHVVDPLGVGPTVTPIDNEIYKFVTQEYLLNVGVTILYYTELLQVVKEEDTIEKVVVKTRSGFYTIKADCYIDATGEGEVAYLAGNPMKIGREKDAKCQPMSMLFKVGNVNVDKVVDYCDKHPSECVLKEGLKSLGDVERIAISGFFSLIEEARKVGDFNINRDRVLFFELTRRGEVIINMSRIIDKLSVKDFELSDATIEGRRQVMEIYKFLKKYIPGFEEAILLQTADEIGVRESRRVVGEYELTAQDILNNKIFEDTIALGSWPIDIHDPEGKELSITENKDYQYYGIPYGCLLPTQLKNVIVTGRAISATHEALASTRVSPTCMALGQAAGIAASLCSKEKIYFKDLPIERLQEKLLESNQVLEIKGAVAK